MYLHAALRYSQNDDTSVVLYTGQIMLFFLIFYGGVRVSLAINPTKFRKKTKNQHILLSVINPLMVH